jgi:hypothetical protein
MRTTVWTATIAGGTYEGLCPSACLYQLALLALLQVSEDVCWFDVWGAYEANAASAVYGRVHAYDQQWTEVGALAAEQCSGASPSGAFVTCTVRPLHHSGPLSSTHQLFLRYS